MLVIANNITTRNARLNRVFRQLKEAGWSTKQPATKTLQKLAEQCAAAGADVLELSIQQYHYGPQAMQFAVNAMPMSTLGDLLEKGRQRYLNSNGSWEKKEPLDQIDLVYMEAMEEPVPSRVIARLVQELRAERSWPTPPKVEPNFTYVDKE